MPQHKTIPPGLVRTPKCRIAEQTNQRALGSAACGSFIGEQLETDCIGRSFYALENLYFSLKIVHYP